MRLESDCVGTISGFFSFGCCLACKVLDVSHSPATLDEFLSQAAIGSIPGPIVVGFSLAYFTVLVLVALLTMSMIRSKSSYEGIATQTVLEPSKIESNRNAKTKRVRFGLKQQKIQLLAFIVTDKADDVAKHILSKLKRGVTKVASEEGAVLICALTKDEIRILKDAVSIVDADATVNLSPAQEVWGKVLTHSPMNRVK
jgi:uncharacterized membrane-anchored protein YitT (DUF2179 family)